LKKMTNSLHSKNLFFCFQAVGRKTKANSNRHVLGSNSKFEINLI
jgi:hypothetical protein